MTKGLAMEMKPTRITPRKEEQVQVNDRKEVMIGDEIQR